MGSVSGLAQSVWVKVGTGRFVTGALPKKMGAIESNLLFLLSDAYLSFIGCVKCCCKGILFVSFFINVSEIVLMVNSASHAGWRNSGRKECTLRQIYARG